MGQGSSQIRVRVAVVVLNEQNEILLVRQNGKPFWVLPGGTLEPGETLATCGERELMEELSLTVQCGNLLGVSEFITASRHVVDTVFYANWVGEKTDRLVMTEDENLDEVGWFSKAATSSIVVQPQGLWQKVLDAWEDDFSVSNSLYLPGHPVS